MRALRRNGRAQEEKTITAGVITPEVKEIRTFGIHTAALEKALA